MKPIPVFFCSLLVATASLAELPDDVTLDPAFGGQFFATPLGVRHAGDGSGRRFVIERDGVIRIVDSDNQVLAAPFLDISSSVNSCGEGGLLGLAFHPDYASNGRFFVHYTSSSQGPCHLAQLISHIAEFAVSGGDPNQADAGSENHILSIPQDANNHNGGDLHFGPDGYLYIGIGDGGGGNDPCDRGQTLDPDELSVCGNHPTTPVKALLGKMLRLDVDNQTAAGANNLCGAAGDGSAAYTVPATNPYSGMTDRCGEVWGYGLRNPWRFSFDRDNGDLWIADVGQDHWEEVNVEPGGDSGGRNYGWKICEGNWLRGSTTVACTLGDHFAPVLEYPNTNNQTPSIPGEGCSVTGGYRYRGPVASMQGLYVYGDYCSGRVWFASESEPGVWVTEEFTQLDGFGNLVGFGEDEAGHLYLTRGSGQVLIFNGDEDDGSIIFHDRFENGQNP
jgi:glucose/arabinose dehydrogenase